MTAVRASGDRATGAVPDAPAGRFVRPLSLCCVGVLVLVAALSGSAVAVDGSVDSLDDPTTPLGNATGPTEVIVRFAPVEDPDALGEPDGNGSAADDCYVCHTRRNGRTLIRAGESGHRLGGRRDVAFPAPSRRYLRSPPVVCV